MQRLRRYKQTSDVKYKLDEKSAQQQAQGAARLKENYGAPVS